MGSMDMDIMDIFIISALVSQLLVTELPGCLEPSLQQLPRDALGPTERSASNRAATARAMRFGVRSSYIWDPSDPVGFPCGCNSGFWKGLYIWGWWVWDQSKWFSSLVQIWIPDSRIWIHGNFRFFKYEPRGVCFAKPLPNPWGPKEMQANRKTWTKRYSAATPKKSKKKHKISR